MCYLDELRKHFTPVGGEISHTVYNGPEAHPASSNNRYRLIPEGKAARTLH